MATLVSTTSRRAMSLAGAALSPSQQRRQRLRWLRITAKHLVSPLLTQGGGNEGRPRHWPFGSSRMVISGPICWSSPSTGSGEVILASPMTAPADGEYRSI